MCTFQSTLTWVGLEQNFRLPQDLLGPVLGAVGTRQQVLQVRVQLGLLGLSQFLLCELKAEQLPGHIVRRGATPPTIPSRLQSGSMTSSKTHWPPRLFDKPPEVQFIPTFCRRRCPQRARNTTRAEQRLCAKNSSDRGRPIRWTIEQQILAGSSSSSSSSQTSRPVECGRCF